MKTVFIKCPILSLQCSIVDVSRVLLRETKDFYILKSWAGNKKRLTLFLWTFFNFLWLPVRRKVLEHFVFLMLHKREFFDVLGLNLV